MPLSLANAISPIALPFNPAPAAGALSYATILQNNYEADEIWPLVDIDSGTTIHAFIEAARDGTLAGWDLQAGAGPVTGTLAPALDGANDYGDVDTASLVSLFDGEEGSIFLWFEVDSEDVWTDATTRFLINLNTDSNNFIRITKANTDDDLDIRYKAGGTTTTIGHTTAAPKGWTSLALTWSLSNDELKLYIDGQQVESTGTGLGTWAGALTSAYIGASTSSPSNVWHGALAYVAFRAGARWSDLFIEGMHDTAAGAGAD